LTSKRPHPEQIEAHKVLLDALLPDQASTLPFLRGAPDPCRVVVTIAPAERHKLYVGRLVMVLGPDGGQRQSCIEELGAEEALVRYID
jgi:hypothetical protein